MASNTEANIWSLMDYVPPRGSCNFKNGIVSGTCPCLRFMVHPFEAESSFECDGCSHHASFHRMDNKAEDELIKRWKAEDRKKQQENGQDKEESRSRKCPRKAIEQDSTSATVISDDDDQYRLYSYFVEGVQSAIPGTRRKVKD